MKNESLCALLPKDFNQVGVSNDSTAEPPIYGKEFVITTVYMYIVLFKPYP